MAKTLIGQLILRLRTEGLGEADKLRTTLRDVEQNARRLGQTKGPEWGRAFQRSLEQLRLAPREIDAVQRSWLDMHEAMRSRNIGAALRLSEVAHWKTQTVGHFAAVRAEAKRAHEETEQFYRLARRGGNGVGVALGMGGGLYGAGYVGRAAARAGSEEQRVQAEAKFAGLNESERSRLDARANELAVQYRSNKAIVLEVLKDATLNMATIEDALASSEPMAKAVLALGNIHGQEAAVNGLRLFNRAMDNIEKIEPGEYYRMLDGYMRAQQVIGADIDPGAFEQAIKYSRIAGKVANDTFLTQRLPMLIAQIGGKNAGTQIRAFFDQFVIARAPKNALAQQREYGLRDGEDRLIGQDLFGSDPIKWVYDYLLPQLRKAGVDTDDEIELARIIGRLTNNVNSADAIMSAILNQEQWDRVIEQRLPNAAGLDAALEVQNLNPFAAWQGMVDSLKNLSGAVGESVLPGTVQGLNSLADGINSFQQRIREGDALASGALIGGGAAGAGGAAYFARSVYRLITAGDRLQVSATRLDTSAAALTRAATALGGSAAADGAIPDGDGKSKGKPGKGRGKLGLAAGLGAATAATAAATLPIWAGDTPGDTFDEQLDWQRDYNEQNAETVANIREWVARQTFSAGADIGAMVDPDQPAAVPTPAPGTPVPSAAPRTPVPTAAPSQTAERGGRVAPASEPDPGRFGDPVATVGLDTTQAQVDAATARQQLSEALKVQGTATLDTTPAAAALRELLALANRVQAVVGAIAPAAQAQTTNLGVEMRRNFSD